MKKSKGRSVTKSSTDTGCTQQLVSVIDDFIPSDFRFISVIAVAASVQFSVDLSGTAVGAAFVSVVVVGAKGESSAGISVAVVGAAPVSTFFVATNVKVSAEISVAAKCAAVECVTSGELSSEISGTVDGAVVVSVALTVAVASTVELSAVIFDATAFVAPI